MNFELLGGIAAVLTVGVAGVYLAMAFGLRSGEMVWGGRHVGRLPTEQRIWSLIYGLALVAAALVLLELSGVYSTGLIPEAWLTSAGFAAMSLLGLATLGAVARGSTQERWIFAPVTLGGAVLAGWLLLG